MILLASIFLMIKICLNKLRSLLLTCVLLLYIQKAPALIKKDSLFKCKTFNDAMVLTFTKSWLKSSKSFGVQASRSVAHLKSHKLIEEGNKIKLYSMIDNLKVQIVIKDIKKPKALDDYVIFEDERKFKVSYALYCQKQ